MMARCSARIAASSSAGTGSRAAAGPRDSSDQTPAPDRCGSTRGGAITDAHLQRGSAVQLRARIVAPAILGELGIADGHGNRAAIGPIPDPVALELPSSAAGDG